MHHCKTIGWAHNLLIGTNFKERTAFYLHSLDARITKTEIRYRIPVFKAIRSFS